jgi:hypothetical protein
VRRCARRIRVTTSLAANAAAATTDHANQIRSAPPATNPAAPHIARSTALSELVSGFRAMGRAYRSHRPCAVAERGDTGVASP